MKSIALIAGLICVGLLSACQTTSNVDCTKVDFVHYVAAGDGCLAITVLNQKTDFDDPTMLVFLNGDQYGQGHKLDLSDVMVEIKADHAIMVEMSRPGYRNWRGNQSSGSAQWAGWAPVSETDVVADGVRNLVEYYAVGRLILMGQSGGAAYAAVIAGRHPGLVDIAILHGCPCDYTQMDVNGYNVAINPQSYADGVPQETYVVAINGRDDTYTPWRPVRNYIEFLQERGVPAKMILTDGGHFMYDRWNDIEEVVDLALARDRTDFDALVNDIQPIE